MTAIVYSCIARGSIILCSHHIGNNTTEDVVRNMLPNIPTRTDAKTTYTSHNYMFHVMVENGLIYLCASDPDFGRRQPYAYLTEIKRDFMSGGTSSRAHFADEGDLNDEFSPNMAMQMERFSRSEGGDQISILQAQVEDVKGVMTQNIEKVLERGDRLDDLMTKTEDLEASSSTFQKATRRVHRKMFWKSTKMTILLVAVALVVIMVIILIILFSTGVLPPKGGGDKPITTTLAPTTTTLAP